jgi:hypothetical protein
MSLRNVMLCAALGLGAIASPMMASARVYVDIDVAPPPARVEVVPGPRVGYVWAPGYWNYSGHRHVWVGGRWYHERHGRHWVNDRWDQRGDRWHHDRGHWDRD